nr:CBS domain-containing protein [Leptolyngbya sp. PCC 6406]
MDLVLCHTTADFDTLGAAVGITLLQPGTRIVLAGGCHPTVQTFLAFHRDEYALIERRAVPLEQVGRITVVDTQRRERLGSVADWIDGVVKRGGAIALYDHHPGGEGDIPATERHVEAVGAATTLVVEQLQAQGATLTVAQANVMALGIHVDTGSLTFETTTPRDATALAWLMTQGALPRIVSEFIEPELSPLLRHWLENAIADLHRERHGGHTLAWVHLAMDHHIPGLSGLADRLITLSDSDSLLLAASYPLAAGSEGSSKLVLIGRARGRGAAQGDRPGLNFGALFSPLGGGGHAAAAAVTLTVSEPSTGEVGEAIGGGSASETLVQQILQQLRQQIPTAPTAQEIMSSPVRTLRPHTSIQEAQRILLRYGHSGLSVVDEEGSLVGIISRRDIDLALHHGFSHAPVKGYMTTNLKTITTTTPLPEIEALMVTYDIGRLPVLDQDQLVGIVTRTDVLRQRHTDGSEDSALLSAPSVPRLPSPAPTLLLRQMKARLSPDLWTILSAIADLATRQGWHLYLVGGAVRELFLTPDPMPLNLQDVDLVVDGADPAPPGGAGPWLAQAVQVQYPEVEVQIYGRFQTAALVWHRATGEPNLMIDIATARTEFYPYPAANPEVEASSIRQDLYRRDFTINAMALRLTPPQPGLLLDFFGGRLDVQQRQVRVLHANSFIEDPTRIYRAVRFAVRLGFTLDPQTEGFIHHAIHSGIYTQLQREIVRLPGLQTRLKAELKLIFQAPYWQTALALLDRLGALGCLHPDLVLSHRLWHQMRRVSRWMTQVPALAGLVPWQMRLEVLIAAIPADPNPDPNPRDKQELTPQNQRAVVATNLQLPQETVDRLTHLADVETALIPILSQRQPPSVLAQALSPYDLGTLVLVSVRHPRPMGQIIWRYLMAWSQVNAPLNGHDLQALGYRRGPHYRQMLTALLAATLDGKICDRASAEAFLRHHYPLPE